MPTLTDLRSERIKKLESLQKKGVNPYPPTVRRSHTTNEARGHSDQAVDVVGRIMSIRGHGKIQFIDIQDESGKIQVVCKKDVLPEKEYSIIDDIDVGDFLSVTGVVGTTSAGEISVFATGMIVVHKSLRPIPDSWYGLKDTEERYRKRYLDMIINPKVKKVLDARWKIERAIRMFLWNEGYSEVETPILQPLYGGTNAKPFTTHMNALDSDFYLRVAPELYLKRLMVGGYERVFEIARNFRNEGIDLTHQPEFTMMEFYEAYADYHRIMDLTESLIRFASHEANGGYSIKVGEHDIDLSGSWKRITVDEAVQTYLGIDWNTISDEEVKTLLEKHKVDVVGSWSKNKALFALYDHEVTGKLIEPTWVIDYPQEVSPLAKEHRSKEGRVERFEGYIGGKEICDGWSEIVSGLEQRKRFESEQKNMKAGDKDAHPLDEEFLTALEYGCPPLGGIGIGIDRLVMFLTNTWAIREVIPFPTLRMEHENHKESIALNNKPIQRDSSESALSLMENDQGSISYETVKTIVSDMTKNTGLQKHMMAVECIMRSLARHFKEDENLWGMTGLIHDADYEMFKEDPKKHPSKIFEVLKAHHAPQSMVNAIYSHAWGWREDLPEPKTKMEWALFGCDELSGLITACALVRPDKKIEQVELSSVMKKWKVPSFAAGVDRHHSEIASEKLGMTLDDFVQLALDAMKKEHERLGL